MSAPSTNNNNELTKLNDKQQTLPGLIVNILLGMMVGTVIMMIFSIA